jgi:hypothetical protein
MIFNFNSRNEEETDFPDFPMSDPSPDTTEFDIEIN